MAMYIDHYCIVDTEEILFATSVDGQEAYDGYYFITFIIAMGDHSKEVIAKYPTKGERDEALIHMGLLIKGDHECYDINESDE